MEKSFNCTAYIMVGIPGSGKSTWVCNNLNGVKQISRDIIRKNLGYTQSEDEKVVLTREQETHVTNVENNIINDCCKKGIDFVVDDINIGKYRKELLQRIRNLGARIVIVKFTTPLEVCIKRREGQIPEDAMRKIYQRANFNIDKSDYDELIIV